MDRGQLSCRVVSAVACVWVAVLSAHAGATHTQARNNPSPLAQNVGAWCPGVACGLEAACVWLLLHLLFLTEAGGLSRVCTQHGSGHTSKLHLPVSIAQFKLQPSIHSSSFVTLRGFSLNTPCLDSTQLTNTETNTQTRWRM
jgi:hypothetical protein